MREITGFFPTHICTLTRLLNRRRTKKQKKQILIVRGRSPGLSGERFRMKDSFVPPVPDGASPITKEKIDDGGCCRSREDNKWLSYDIPWTQSTVGWIWKFENTDTYTVCMSLMFVTSHLEQYSVHLGRLTLFTVHGLQRNHLGATIGAKWVVTIEVWKDINYISLTV